MEINNELYPQYPLGAALLYLGGARQNLNDALKVNDLELIWIRCKELSLILFKIEKSFQRRSTNNSLVDARLINNLDSEKRISKKMLSDASSRLSAALVLV